MFFYYRNIDFKVTFFGVFSPSFLSVGMIEFLIIFLPSLCTSDVLNVLSLFSESAPPKLVCIFGNTTIVSGHTLSAPGEHLVWCTVAQLRCVCVCVVSPLHHPSLGKSELGEKCGMPGLCREAPRTTLRFFFLNVGM